jgi:hypothetical protein
VVSSTPPAEGCLMYEGKIPFDQYGSPVPFAGAIPARDIWWKDNEPFEATLTFQWFERGRSAAHAIYAKADDPTWQAVMFLSDLGKLIEADVAPLHIRGTFIFVKRGTNYGIQLIEP